MSARILVREDSNGPCPENRISDGQADLTQCPCVTERPHPITSCTPHAAPQFLVCLGSHLASTRQAVTQSPNGIAETSRKGKPLWVTSSCCSCPTANWAQGMPGPLLLAAGEGEEFKARAWNWLECPPGVEASKAVLGTQSLPRNPFPQRPDPTPGCRSRRLPRVTWGVSCHRTAPQLVPLALEQGQPERERAAAPQMGGPQPSREREPTQNCSRRAARWTLSKEGLPLEFCLTRLHPQNPAHCLSQSRCPVQVD